MCWLGEQLVEELHGPAPSWLAPPTGMTGMLTGTWEEGFTCLTPSHEAPRRQTCSLRNLSRTWLQSSGYELAQILDS